MIEFRLHILNPNLAQVFIVPVGITVIGREPTTSLPLVDPQVSRRHAHLISDGSICELIDQGSANGTFVNDERLLPQAPRTLEDGMILRFGPVSARFEVIAAPVAVEPHEPEPAAAPPPEEPAPPEPALEEVSLHLEYGSETRQNDPLGEEVPPPPEVTPQQLSADGGESGVPVEVGPPGGDGGREIKPPDLPPAPAGTASANGDGMVPPGLSVRSQKLINYLPGIYHTDFMARFLGIFESIHTPIEWTVEGFDLFLSPDTSPTEFLNWLAGWYGLAFDSSWGEDQRRLILREAYAIFARRGTRWALARVLEIYTGCTPEIDDAGEKLDPFTFSVRIPLPESQANRTLLTRLIDSQKPAYTTYTLELIK